MSACLFIYELIYSISMSWGPPKDERRWVLRKITLCVCVVWEIHTESESRLLLSVFTSPITKSSHDSHLPWLAWISSGWVPGMPPINTPTITSPPPHPIPLLCHLFNTEPKTLISCQPLLVCCWKLYSAFVLLSCNSICSRNLICAHGCCFPLMSRERFHFCQ